MNKKQFGKIISVLALVFLTVVFKQASPCFAAEESVPLPPRKQAGFYGLPEKPPVPGNKPVIGSKNYYGTGDSDDNLLVQMDPGGENAAKSYSSDKDISGKDSENVFVSRLLNLDSFRSIFGTEEKSSINIRAPGAVESPNGALPVIPERRPEMLGPNIYVYRSFEQGDPPVPELKPVPGPGEEMTEKNARLYRLIFSAQSHGDIDAANRYFSKLSDLRLRGHVLLQRYLHPTAYITSFEELEGWLRIYADHPGSSKIYRLALAKKPANWRGHLRRPAEFEGISGYLESEDERSKNYVSSKKRSRSENRQVAGLLRKIRALVERGAPTSAWNTLGGNKDLALDDTEFDIMRGYIAYGYLHAGKIDKALRHSKASVSRSGLKVPLGGWVAGLINWRRGKYDEAAKYFEITARSPYASGWTVSAGAYWASRAHMKMGNVRAVSYWLEKTANYPRTFYGLIATRALGRRFEFNWDMPQFTMEHKKLLQTRPEALRAMLLLQAGQTRPAEQELKQIGTKNNTDIEKALLAYASHAGLPSFAMKLANAIPHPEGGFYDAALYPIVPWKPEEGYKIDLALIHAIMRQESRFDPDAENRSGATGLMQLMPSTASYVSGSRKYKSKSGRYRLKDPITNIKIGQKYVAALLKQKNVNQDLFALSIAYNAGPGNLARWKSMLGSIEDPLLFVESIPVAQTRAYVERVLANYWIYRLRLGQKTPTLDAVAEGKWARYVSLDQDSYLMADLR
jgi:soluble lytic murein transglycosylase-like protein